MENTKITTTEKIPKIDMKTLLQTHRLQVPKPGETIEGRFVKAGKGELYLDLGFSCGVVRGKELAELGKEYQNLKIGDVIPAVVLELENENGDIELSLRQAGRKQVWDKLKKLMEDKEVVSVKVTDANRGGLMIKLNNIAGFLPVSQLTAEHYPRVEGGDKQQILEKLKKFVGSDLKARVITAEEESEKLVVSEKAAHEEQQKKALDRYRVGDIVEGVVTGVVDFGAFVEFSGPNEETVSGPNGLAEPKEEKTEGLVHISELAWQRIDDPRDVIIVGDKVKAKIIGIDADKVSLSIRSLLKDPWENIEERYKVGQQVRGTVLKINPFGLFVELDPEIHGLAHISHLDLKPGQKATDEISVGDKIDFEIISIESKHHRLGLKRVVK